MGYFLMTLIEAVIVSTSIGLITALIVRLFIYRSRYKRV